MKKNRCYNTTKIFYVFIAILLWANVFLCPQASLGSEQFLVTGELLIKHKVPTRVLQELAAGQFQDLIVEFEHQDIREEAAEWRRTKRLRFNDNQIAAFKTARYRARKKRTFDAVQQAELDVIKDYKHLPLAFVRIKNRRALIIF